LGSDEENLPNGDFSAVGCPEIEVSCPEGVSGCPDIASGCPKIAAGCLKVGGSGGGNSIGEEKPEVEEGPDPPMEEPCNGYL
jgi:hypothetical protein